MYLEVGSGSVTACSASKCEVWGLIPSMSRYDIKGMAREAEVWIKTNKKHGDTRRKPETGSTKTASTWHQNNQEERGGS